jgi:ribonuclease Z
MRPALTSYLVNGPFGDPVVYIDVMFERRAFLFDIGDIRGLPARKLLRVSDVFVTHAHMDHFAGFDHLLRLTLGRDRTVSLYGPAGFIAQVHHKLQAYTWNVIANYAGSLIFNVSEIHESGAVRRARFQASHAFRCEPMPEAHLEGNMLISCGALRVRCAVLEHGTPCLGYVLEEPDHVNVWKVKMDAQGLAVGPWLRNLKHAVLAGAPSETPIRALRRSGHGTEPVTLALGELRDIVRVVPGQKIAYVVDVRFNMANAERIVHLASRADMLFIECAFLDADAEHAARKNHLTAWQAGMLARRAQALRIMPCHFSARYADHGDALLEEAQAAFSGNCGQSEMPTTR